MAHPAVLVGDRTWFVDVRAPARRMAVTVHPQEGVAVISLWQDGRCTATFRMPLHDASRLIGVLADGMASALPLPLAELSAPRSESRWRRMLARLRPRKQTDADIVPLRRLT